MSWYRTYRPRQVKDLQLQSVQQTLLSMMAEATIPQALLFAGPKGTGKTSASRILAAVLNDSKNSDAADQQFLKPQKGGKRTQFVEPDPDSTVTKRICFGQSFAVQEIDAASHGLVDDIRQLKERASLLPQEGKMAVYILDEVHMMSGAAFNAFLKLLEEPPAHCVFILATTELHKIPATIASRCALVQFHKASLDEIVRTLKRILDSESVKYQAKQLLPIAEAADGSFRDGVKLLELSVANGVLDDALIEQVTGGSYQLRLNSLLSAVINKDEQEVSRLLMEWRSTNTDQTKLYRNLFTKLHEDLLMGLKVTPGTPDRQVAVNQFLLQQLLAANLFQTSPIPLLTLEIALLDIVARAKQKASAGSSSKPSPTTPKTSVASPEIQDEDEDEIQPSETSEQITEDTANAVLVAEVELPAQLESTATQETKLLSSEPTQTFSPSELLAKWHEFVTAVAAKNSGLAALLRSSQPSASGNNAITIGVFYKFHQEQLQQPKFITILESCCREVMGGEIPFAFQLSAAEQTSQNHASDTMLVAAIPQQGASVPPTPPNNGALAAMASEVLL